VVKLVFKPPPGVNSAGVALNTEVRGLRVRGKVIQVRLVRLLVGEQKNPGYVYLEYNVVRGTRR
jgi:hypothetical protein